MKKLTSILLTALLTVSCVFPVSAADAGLRFRDDGTFTILHITDTQDDHHPSPEMLNLLKRSIETADPDLIVFTGDIVEDKKTPDLYTDNEPWREGVNVYDIKQNINVDNTLANLKNAIDPIFAILEESGVPYAVAQGNNDHKCGITNAEWLELYSAYPGGLTFDASGDADGRIDYNLPVYGTDGSMMFNVWMMDTGKGGVNEEQLEWYRAASAGLTADNGGVPVPAILFQHIPTADVGNLFVSCASWEDGATADGVNFYRLDPAIASGKNFYAYPPCEPTAQFAAWKECGDVIGAYFGHQHVEGFTGTYDGIEMGLTYGMEFSKPGPYGFRVITLHEDDITDFDNALYVYTGSAALGTDKITKQNDSPDGFPAFLQAFRYIFNVFKSMISVIVSLFA